MGLRWSDIDLDGQTLRVSRQLQSVREGGGLIFSDPKNASRPTVDLPQSALHALKGVFVDPRIGGGPRIVAPQNLQRPSVLFGGDLAPGEALP